MIEQMEKNTIVTLKLKGKSNREVARITGIHRKTEARYWTEYQRLAGELQPDSDNRATQEEIVSQPRYDTTSRMPLKYTTQIDGAIDAILESEAEGDYESQNSGRSLKTSPAVFLLMLIFSSAFQTFLFIHNYKQNRQDSYVRRYNQKWFCYAG